MNPNDDDSMAVLPSAGKGVSLSHSGSRSGDPDGELKAQSRGRTFSGDLAMRIEADGTWIHEGRPITRMGLVRLFASVLERADDGSYWLVTPVEMGRIPVADAPFIAVELIADGNDETQNLSLRTNLGDIIPIDADHPLRVQHDLETGEPRPYAMVRNGLEARLLRSVFYDVADLAVEAASGDYGVWSHGTFFRLDQAEAI